MNGPAVLLLSGGVVAAVAVGASYLLGELLTRPPPQQPLEPSPRDAELPFEGVTFASHDGLRLVGWLMGPRLTKPPVVILHGYMDNKHSYLSQARFLFEHGYPSLVYDQRGHGESSPARISLGPLEAKDVVQALEWLRQRGRGERFVLWGVSMGAATALLAAARSPLVAGLIAESSYERLHRVVADTLRLRFHLPPIPFAPSGVAFASLLAGVNLFRCDVGKAVRALEGRPLLLISGGRDPRMPPETGQRLLARAEGWKAHLVVPDADHAECWLRGQPEYAAKVLELLERAGLH